MPYDVEVSGDRGGVHKQRRRKPACRAAGARLCSAPMETDGALMDFLAQCRAVITDHGGLMASLFVAGLVGSATHCVGMCGPFVLSQTLARLESVPAARMTEMNRLTGALLLPYHLGRATTYMTLGGLAAGLAGGMVAASGFKWISAGLLVLAALFFLGYALRRLGVSLPASPRGNRGWSQKLGDRLRPLFAKPVGWRGYFLGVALGFLPCGLLYAAVAASAASADWLAGSFAMAAFVVGTVPMLVVIGFAGQVAGERWRQGVGKVAPVLLLINALALIFMAWRIVA